jgi:hypothetical protein
VCECVHTCACVLACMTHPNLPQSLEAGTPCQHKPYHPHRHKQWTGTKRNCKGPSRTVSTAHDRKHCTHQEASLRSICCNTHSKNSCSRISSSFERKPSVAHNSSTHQAGALVGDRAQCTPCSQPTLVPTTAAQQHSCLQMLTRH